MKTKILIAIILASFIQPCFLNAQSNVSTNIGSQPIWGPVGYDHVENYYMPEIESYYNVTSKKYMYMINGKWITSTTLPSRYIKYDLYHGYKAVINGPNPYLHFNKHRVKYISYWNKRNQVPIRDSKETKYYINKDHPNNNEWKEDRSGKKGDIKVKNDN